MEYGFLPQGALKELNGTTAGYYYVQQAQYDAAGLLDLQKLGAASLAANPLLSRDYSYYTWTETVGGIGQGGGLKSLTSQASLTQQNLSYTYDKTDNITSIVDAVAGETMNYTYDTLNRLTGASGAQSESYDYNATTGNLATKNGASYNYGDGNHDHAVTSLSTGATFVYDLTGNMTERKVNGQGYAYTYDAENRLTGAASEDLFDNGFESGSFSAWSSSVTDGGDLSVTGAAALEGSWGMQAVIDDNNSIYVTDQTPQDKTAYTASFRYDPNSIGMGSRELFTLLAGYRDDNALTFELQQYYASGSRKLRAVLYLDSGSTSTTSDYTITDAPHTVQVEWQAATGAGANNGSLKLTIDGQLKQTLSGKDNDTRQVDYLRLGAVAGIDSSTRGTLYLDDFRSWDPTAAVQAQFHYDGDGRRVQSVVNGVTTAFVGQYFEWTGSTSTMKKYYYFGAQRMAVRDGNGTGTTGLSWLLTDHLGSTTVTLDAAGAKNAEKRYKPWGEERFTFGTLPTQYTYTGQFSHTAQFGLLFYNARWFDPLLSRFAQADTIIPGTGFSIAWDRYAGMNNNPIRWNDPSGHLACDEDGYCYDHGELVSSPKQPRVKLSDAGKEIKNIYEDYANTDGWWRSGDGQFSVQDFLGFWVLNEGVNESFSTWFIQAKWIATVVAQILFVGGYNSASGSSINAIFNFMGSWMDVDSRIRKGPTSENSNYPREQGFEKAGYDAREKIRTMGFMATHPATVLDWDQNSGPSNWGNRDGVKNLEDITTGSADATFYYRNGSFIVLSVDQANRLGSQLGNLTKKP